MKLISNIVFTKNRPLQLHAYLESLYKQFSQKLIKTYIIYKVELFEQQYDELFKQFPECVVIREKDFHGDFLNILSQVDTEYILFGVDDVVFFDSVDFNVIDSAFHQNADNIFGFALRFGPGSLEKSSDVITPLWAGGQEIYRLNWKVGQTPHTRYPFELCSTFYKTELVRYIMAGLLNNNPVIRTLFSPSSLLIKAFAKIALPRQILKSFGYFYSPNKLESWPCRWCQNHKEQMPDFTYFQKLCAAAIQVNMVNTSTDNTHFGTQEHSVEALNEKYKQGYRLNIDFEQREKPSCLSGGEEFFEIFKKQQTKPMPTENS